MKTLSTFLVYLIPISAYHFTNKRSSKVQACIFFSHFRKRIRTFHNLPKHHPQVVIILLSEIKSETPCKLIRSECGRRKNNNKKKHRPPRYLNFNPPSSLFKLYRFLVLTDHVNHKSSKKSVFFAPCHHFYHYYF